MRRASASFGIHFHLRGESNSRSSVGMSLHDKPIFAIGFDPCIARPCQFEPERYRTGFIGGQADDDRLIREVLEVKNEIDRLREQVQNVE